ncbi:transmembrane protein PFT27 [Plectosphaerella plurivora]|uniref:Transmembrane protein PFT27 n=1 Tax=Plectosphaerella plurivora TaxID=936078 RepID=A0A9P8V1P2_9PEZI|nr:transmembrane protein PFT27 [Plectosphaerella plurivora]
MRLRSRRSPLLLLLVPYLAVALATPSTSNTESRAVAVDAEAGSALHARGVIGTKDAPVDGKDGMPHQGPFVDHDESTGRAVDAQVKTTDANDGVMDDPDRQKPKIGTTGTEGGVSEKDKARKALGETGFPGKPGKVPEPPKEVPPLPHGDEERLQKEGEHDHDHDHTSGQVGGLDKPADLPQKSHDDPVPIPDSANKDHLDISHGSSSDSLRSGEEEGLIQPLHSYVLSLTMILVSEVGDKTFLVAALMAMKHDRMVVFSAAFSALLVMTVLSAVLGHAVPALIPKRLTSFAAAILFLVFGAKLLREGMAMDPNEGVTEELHEVERELAEKEEESRRRGGNSHVLSPQALEMGLGNETGRKSRSQNRFPSPPLSPASTPSHSPSRGRLASATSLLQGLNNLCSLVLSPAWVQTFIMTFLGEWGDRSQIATIAMAAGDDYWWVTIGAMTGHCICTGVAVIGGRAIAGKVSLKVVTVGGALAFLVFGFIYLFESFYA